MNLDDKAKFRTDAASISAGTVTAVILIIAAVILGLFPAFVLSLLGLSIVKFNVKDTGWRGGVRVVSALMAGCMALGCLLSGF